MVMSMYVSVYVICIQQGPSRGRHLPRAEMKIDRRRLGGIRMKGTVSDLSLVHTELAPVESDQEIMTSCILCRHVWSRYGIIPKLVI